MTAHATVATHAPDGEAAGRNLLLGVRLFILSEVMLFGALFVTYFVLRAAAPAWPPIPALERPDLPLVGVNTAILLSSSVTLQWAIIRLGRDERRAFRQGLGVTLLLGTIFLTIQAYEFATNGFGISDGVFGSTFYILTGFHGAHVLGGLLLMLVVANRARLGLVTAAHSTAPEAVSYYWHFVDAVWLVLFTTVYVL